MHVAVVGLGYVGLVTSACLAHLGHQVAGLEISDNRLSELRSGRVPFHEPGLDEMVRENVASSRLSFSSDASTLVDADIVIIAVGTHDGNGGWQTASLIAALKGIVPRLRDGATIVIRSTMPPGFGGAVTTLAQRLRAEHGLGDLPIVVNPEFTREGAAIADYLQPNRIVIGVLDDPDGAGVRALQDLYRGFDAPVLIMDGSEASLAKLAANLFLATKISFANELASLCEAFGGNVDTVVASMGHDPRIGTAFLRSGVGFGGSCLPHQVSMTVRAAVDAGIDVPLLQAVSKVNDGQRVRFVDRLAQLAGGIDGRRVALLGLAFKPDTDDLRDAPSLSIAAALVERGASVVAYDPMERARTMAARLVPGLTTVASAREALTGADVAGLVTEWPEFIRLDWDALGGLMRDRAVVDGRNVLDRTTLQAAGFRMLSFGRMAVGDPSSGAQLEQTRAAESSTPHLVSQEPWSAQEPWARSA